MTVPTEPSAEPRGWNAAGVALAIFLGGASVLAALTVWAIGASGGPPSAIAAPVVAAATQDDGAMPGMPGMTSTGSAATSTASPPAATTADAAASSKALPAHATYDAGLPALSAGTEHHYTIRLLDETFEIAPGVRYEGWTFDGGSPGPVVHVRQGDWVDITLVNDGAIPHSIDFHAALIAPDVAFKTIPKGGSVHFRFRADTPGAFMYHCGTPPVLAHIANGMYGAIIVDPKAGDAAGREELRPCLGRVVPRWRR